MKIFISDLHLGDGSKADDFSRDKELLKFLNFVEYQKAELYLVGDVFELWQCDLDKILWNHAEVFEALLNADAVGINGNHDFIPYSRIWFDTFIDVDEGIIAQHGHQYDQFNRYKNPLFSLKWPIGKYITLLISELERWVHKDADKWAEKMEKKFGTFLWNAANLNNQSHQPKFGMRETLRVEAQRILKNKSNKVVIFGHSHHPELIKFNDGIYANCGTWTDGNVPTYISCVGKLVELRNALTHELIKHEVIED